MGAALERGRFALAGQRHRLPRRMDFRLELIPVPVSDVDRAKAFYAERPGFTVYNDVTVREGPRFIQLTPPGSGCSVSIGEGITEMEPGSLQGLQLVVDDVEAAPDELSGRGLDVCDIRTSRGADSCSSATPTATDGPSSRSPTTARTHAARGPLAASRNAAKE
jgi:predicted enzyme related to lactoylglutathione lyase